MGPSIDERFLFQPDKFPKGRYGEKPAYCRDVEPVSADDTRLHGWYCEHPEPRALVLYLHGNGGNVSYVASRLRFLHRELGASTLAIDYRGYGRSEGTPTVDGAVADARAARAALADYAGVAVGDVVLYGRSLGGAIAVQLAADGEARGVIIDSSFTTLRAAAEHHLPWFLARVVPADRLDSLNTIVRYHGPLLVVHGNADTIVPYDQGKRLFAAANEPKRFVTLDGVDHNDAPGSVYHTAVATFVASLP